MKTDPIEDKQAGEEKRAKDRQRKRRQRFLGLEVAIGDVLTDASPLEGEIVTFDPTTIDGIRDLLRFTGRKLLTESTMTDSYTFTKSACALATVGLKLIETADVSERLAAIEIQLKEQEGQ